MQCRKCGRELKAGQQFCGSCGAPAGGGVPAGRGAPLPKPPVDPMIGRNVLGQFVIRKRLGEGGMGTAYLAEQVGMDRLAVLKVLHPHLLGDAHWVDRFNREAKIASKLNHPNSITLYNFGRTEEGYVYIAMEYVDGRSLSSIIEEEEYLSVERATQITIQICGALQQAHELGIVHRDMKPDNILVTWRGKQEVPKVLDFGIAKVQGAGPDERQLTAAGMIFGTPAYMSPEQFGGGELDGRSDLYSLGVILYEMLTGRRPFQASSPLGYFRMHQEEIPPPLRVVNPHVKVPRDLERAVFKALEKDRIKRFRDAEEMAHALELVMVRAVEGNLGGDLVPEEAPELAQDLPMAALLDEIKRSSASSLPASPTATPSRGIGLTSLLDQLEAEAARTPRASGSRAREQAPDSLADQLGAPQVEELPQFEEIELPGRSEPARKSTPVKVAADPAAPQSPSRARLRNAPPSAVAASGLRGVRREVLEPPPLESLPAPMLVDRPPTARPPAGGVAEGGRPILSLASPVILEQRTKIAHVSQEGSESRPAVAAVALPDLDLPRSQQAIPLEEDAAAEAMVIERQPRNAAEFRKQEVIETTDAQIIAEPPRGSGEPVASPAPASNPAVSPLRPPPETPLSAAELSRSSFARATGPLRTPPEGSPTAGDLSRSSVSRGSPQPGSRSALSLGQSSLGQSSLGQSSLGQSSLGQSSLADSRPRPRSLATSLASPPPPKRSSAKVVILVIVTLLALGGGLFLLRDRLLSPGGSTKLTGPTPGSGNTERAIGQRSTEDMAVLPAIVFTMGDRAQADSPPHPVEVPALLMDRHEVTNAEYLPCTMTRECSSSAFASESMFNAPDLPVVGISYDDAVAYCRWRGRHLPTEVEWERAARGTGGTVWPWGDEFKPGLANVAGDQDGHVRIAPASSYPEGQTPEKILNLAGNAAEWVADSYGPSDRYPRRKGPDPRLEAKDGKARIRGGSWASEPEGTRAALRGERLPRDTRKWTIGFRCAGYPTDQPPSEGAPVGASSR